MEAFVCNIEPALAAKTNPRFGVAVIPMRRLLYRCVNLV